MPYNSDFEKFTQIKALILSSARVLYGAEYYGCTLDVIAYPGYRCFNTALIVYADAKTDSNDDDDVEDGTWKMLRKSIDCDTVDEAAEDLLRTLMKAVGKIAGPMREGQEVPKKY